MILRTLLSNGQYVTMTTRKYNHQEHYFGWASIWRSKKDFDDGDCDYTIEVKNIYLGTDKTQLKTKALKFTLEQQNQWDKVLKNTIKIVNERNKNREVLS